MKRARGHTWVSESSSGSARAGEAYMALDDPKSALAQYEECLARYPRAWNSAEVRRRVERLRKERL